MKSIKSFVIKNNRLFSSVFLIAFLASLIAGAQKTRFLNSDIVPAAEGFVKVKKDNNKNYAITIEIINLAEIKKLGDNKKSYVVWMESDDEVIKNIGQLISSKPFLSKGLAAKFETVSSVRPQKIFITAEEDSQVESPTYGSVMSTDNF